ncbi:MAG: DNA methylase, partial [Selenomonas sp.]|nr:DNA methylase [Selenomonas sp.]
MDEKMKDVYIAIDLKSFYASVECQIRGLNPLTANLVVADESRTAKTICLAVSPALKAYGIPGRARLFEVEQKIKQVNRQRQSKILGHKLVGESVEDTELKANPQMAVAYVVAKPQMAKYMEVSRQIYNVYLRYVAPEDIHVYSIDEVFINAAPYLASYHTTPRELALRMIRDVLQETNITATAGIGTNLYLAKIAMDIVAKHMPPDKDGVRIAELDEMSYRQKLWNHRPLTDFWRVGKGYAKKLQEHGLLTMGDVARCSLGRPQDYHNEDLLYKLFGVNAELLIDHAWGWEPCTMAEIKNYRPLTNSISSGQVLMEPYDFASGQLIVWEMTDLLVLDLVAKGLLTDQIVLDVGYDIVNLQDTELRRNYHGAVHTDHYGRTVPKPAHGSVKLEGYTSSSRKILQAVVELYQKIVQHNLFIRRVTVTANHVLTEEQVRKAEPKDEQLALFTDYAVDGQKQAAER